MERGKKLAFLQSAVVRECQAAGQLREMSDTALTGLIFSTVHGLIGLQGSGRLRPEKGLDGVDPSLHLLVGLLSTKARTKAEQD